LVGEPAALELLSLVPTGAAPPSLELTGLPPPPPAELLSLETVALAGMDAVLATDVPPALETTPGTDANGSSPLRRC
jgi:hypothetical protein